eukprot:GHRR01001006.1.p2 GENE.GHRR01001006.1~~GHRR01001006.1.p2  ORF type:complete len:136 (-),score=14.88 GHRR01001006.1:423-830(-)
MSEALGGDGERLRLPALLSSPVVGIGRLEGLGDASRAGQAKGNPAAVPPELIACCTLGLTDLPLLKPALLRLALAFLYSGDSGVCLIKACLVDTVRAALTEARLLPLSSGCCKAEQSILSSTQGTSSLSLSGPLG